MNSTLKIGLAFVALATVAGCSKSAPTKEEKKDLGDDLANQIGLNLAKDQYKKAKASFDKGESPSSECDVNTDELRAMKSPEAQKLAKDFDSLCLVDYPAQQGLKSLESSLSSVVESRTDKSQNDMLKSNQVALASACDGAKDSLENMKKRNVSGEPKAKALEAKVAEACTTANLEGGPVKTAAAARPKKR